MTTDLCLSALKFSYANGVRADNSIPWSHYQADTLFVIVKGAETRHLNGGPMLDGKLSFRVVDGTKVMESVDIARFVDAAIDARRGAQRTGVTLQLEQLPIFGMTKDSLLALRYRLEDGQARRVQVRLQSATECRQVVSAFERRGMEFPEQRPTTARMGSARPATASAAPDRLLTAKSSQYFGHTTPTTRPSPFTTQQRENRSLSGGQFSDQHHSPAHASGQPHNMDPPLLTRNEVNAPREVFPDRPSTSQLYRSTTTPVQPSPMDVRALLRPQASAISDRPSSASHVATLDAIRQMAKEQDTPPATAIQTPSAIPAHTEQWSSGAPDLQGNPHGSSDLSGLRPDTGRPSTSATSVLPSSQDFELPPKRELPFKRPVSRPDGGEQNFRPGSAALTLPRLLKPKLVKNGLEASPLVEATSPEKHSLSRPSTSSPTKRKLDDLAENDSRPQSAAAIDLATQPAPTFVAQPAHTPSPSKLNLAEHLEDRPSRMDELLNSRRPLAECSQNMKVPRLNSLADAPHEVMDAPLASPPKLNAALQYDPSITAFAAVQSGTNEAEAVSVEEYATQSYQDRQTALDNFMIENLENPAFTKLCEDVESCWRRIALGL